MRVEIMEQSLKEYFELDSHMEGGAPQNTGTAPSMEAMEPALNGDAPVPDGAGLPLVAEDMDSSPVTKDTEPTPDAGAATPFMQADNSESDIPETKLGFAGTGSPDFIERTPEGPLSGNPMAE